jgi:hypothetical protein
MINGIFTLDDDYKNLFFTKCLKNLIMYSNSVERQSHILKKKIQ